MRTTRALLTAAFLTIAPSVWGAPPTDDDIAKAITAFREKVAQAGTDRAKANEARVEGAKAVFEAIPISELSFAQFEKLESLELRQHV